MPRYDSDMDDREPTALDLMRQDWHDDHAAQQEQIDDAAKLFARFLAWESRWEGQVHGYEADEELQELLRAAKEYLDQNPLPKETT